MQMELDMAYSRAIKKVSSLMKRQLKRGRLKSTSIVEIKENLPNLGRG